MLTPAPSTKHQSPAFCLQPGRSRPPAAPEMLRAWTTENPDGCTTLSGRDVQGARHRVPGAADADPARAGQRPDRRARGPRPRSDPAHRRALGRCAARRRAGAGRAGATAGAAGQGLDHGRGARIPPRRPRRDRRKACVGAAPLRHLRCGGVHGRDDRRRSFPRRRHRRARVTGRGTAMAARGAARPDRRRARNPARVGAAFRRARARVRTGHRRRRDSRRDERAGAARSGFAARARAVLVHADACRHGTLCGAAARARNRPARIEHMGRSRFRRRVPAGDAPRRCERLRGRMAGARSQPAARAALARERERRPARSPRPRSASR